MATSAALANAPGSTAGGGGMGSLMGLPSIAAGMPPIPSLTQSSSADGKVSAGFNNSGFSVNLGGGNAGSADGVPSWLLPAAAVLGLVLMLRKKAAP